MTAPSCSQQLLLFNGGVYIEKTKLKNGATWFTGYCGCGESLSAQYLVGIRAWEQSHYTKCSYRKLVTP